MFPKHDTIASYDSELAQAMADEARRQEDHVELIASENYASPRVMEAQGSVLTNKYAEGYPGKRYYGGCEYVDIAEQLAIDRLKKLFGATYANVQPHSGSQANQAVYLPRRRWTARGRPKVAERFSSVRTSSSSPAATTPPSRITRMRLERPTTSSSVSPSRRMARPSAVMSRTSS